MCNVGQREATQRSTRSGSTTGTRIGHDGEDPNECLIDPFGKE